MNLLKRFRPTIAHFRSASGTPTIPPRVFPATGFTTIPASEKLEEENWSWYTPQSFYPVRIGDVLQSKYQVLYKIGYGTTATIWLCRDLLSLTVSSRDEYVCMKSMVCNYASVEREIKAYEILSKIDKTSKSTGKQYVRQALDHFELHHGDRNYHFLIHEPLGVSLRFFLHISRGRFPIDYAQDLAFRMLHALQFIHSAKIIHADLQASNILLRIQDEIVLKDGEEAEIESPSSRKITGQSVVFETRDHPGSLRRWIGNKSGPVLCDFGEARTGKDSHTGLIQPAVYRAPEVFLHLPWGTPVDIWNLGCMVWDFMFGRQLFPRSGAPDEATADKDQLARMVALLGPPPEAFLADLGPGAHEFFNEDGSAKGAAPNETLEEALASSLEQAKLAMTVEESEVFLAFIRRTLTWTEEKRASASGLLNDPWIASLNI
ncbi:kinase-like domain-containing protein [Crassisporium funariophilum]|nr:kinase-like domain-containing protein [Crassisporium funariophilum]